MLEFRILGPVEVLRDGRPVPLGGAKPRALVADLTLHANEVLSADRLIDDLWGEDPPDTASHMLHVQVSRLRKTLEEDGRGVLVTRAPGYMLTLGPPDDLDAARFEAEVRSGVEVLAARPADALAAFDRALALWRGPALEEFAGEAFAQPSATRLEELRQSTQEHRAEALLALGRHDEAVAELEALVARFPLRERLRELQMLALYRAGRQGDALEAFQAARRTLADELGVDPGPSLTSLEQAILRHDPELDAPAAAAVEPAAALEPTAPTPRGRTGRRAWVVGIAAVVLGAAVLLIARLTAPGEPESGPSGGANPDPTGTLQWSEVADPGGRVFGGPGDQVILGGVVTPDGLLAVGYTATKRPSATLLRNYDAAVWIGADSTEWRPVTDAAFAAAGNQEATDAVAVPGRLVVVGSDASAGDHDAAVWTLEDDAVSWSRVDPNGPGIREPGDQWVRGVTWTGSEVVAVGYSRIEGDEDVAIWVSSDTRHWSQLTPSNLGRPGNQQMATVTTSDDHVVAAGFAGSPAGRDAAVWLSRDGVDWNRVADPDLGGEGDQQINALLVGGPGLIAVGQETTVGDQNAAVWVSADGRAWERVEDPTGALRGPGSQQMSTVASVNGLIVAAGTDVVDSTQDAAMWISTNGTSWTREPPTSSGMSTFTDYGRQGVRALVAFDGGFVALGREGRGGDDDADVWTGRVVT